MIDEHNQQTLHTLSHETNLGCCKLVICGIDTNVSKVRCVKLPGDNLTLWRDTVLLVSVRSTAVVLGFSIYSYCLTMSGGHKQGCEQVRAFEYCYFWKCGVVMSITNRTCQKKSSDILLNLRKPSPSQKIDSYSVVNDLSQDLASTLQICNHF